MNRVNKKGNIHKSLTITLALEDWEAVVAHAKEARMSVAGIVAWYIEMAIQGGGKK